MINSTIKYCISVLVFFLSWASFANASITINEIKVSPANERFIKLYNSDSSVDLTGWSIKRKTASGTPYSLVSASRLEGKTISANNYFVLTNEETYIGSLSPDATWAKSYTFSEGNTIILYNQNNEIVDESIISTEVDNTVAEDSNKETIKDEAVENISTSSKGSTSKNNEPEIFKITTKIISPKTVTAGIPFSLSSLTTTNNGAIYAIGKFVWNFGDGQISEMNESKSFDYLYEYPGEYVINLSYYSSIFSKVPDATNKITIKVIDREVSISSVGDNADPFIELENKSNYEILLSDWVVTGGGHYFKIPEGTTLLPNKKIKLSPKITGFVGEDIKSITITNPNKEIVLTYPIIKIQKPVQKSTSTYAIAQKNVSDLNKEVPQIINLNDLGGSAEGSGANIPKATYAWVGLLVIIGLGVASFWIIKKRGSYEDYVEKEIRAEDMTIVE